ncbi:MAG TPA: hypothetical protein VFY73_08360 [Ideonella sp.]|uniref:hypothetical protein n=1 Tax=Ideonella sp. TaxID=1929293 RepID=UPI002E376AE2|nr:hypothetical protein [Ideonella sp.]HEX5684034.1 hypothetical protein [Ideonella sp.]
MEQARHATVRQRTDPAGLPRPSGEAVIVVNGSAANAPQAVAGAMQKLKRTIGAAIAKRHPHHQPVQS